MQFVKLTFLILCSLIYVGFQFADDTQKLGLSIKGGVITVAAYTPPAQTESVQAVASIEAPVEQPSEQPIDQSEIPAS